MTIEEYKLLIELLDKLESEAPCHCGMCNGYERCDYYIYGWDDTCSIKEVREAVEIILYQSNKQGVVHSE